MSTASVRWRIVAWMVMVPGGAVAGLVVDWILYRDWLLNPWFHLLTLPVGLALLKGVFTVSRNTGRVLARHGRAGELPRLETNRLVQVGPYACMRHPMHLGLLFLPLAVALILGSVSFIVCIAPLEALFMLAMIRWVEEPEAIRKFGQDYLAYRRRVPMFNLRPDCLRRLFRPDPNGL